MGCAGFGYEGKGDFGLEGGGGRKALKAFFWADIFLGVWVVVGLDTNGIGMNDCMSFFFGIVERERREFE